MAWTDLSLPMDEADFFVRLIPFPQGRIHGFVKPTTDGTFSMYIDLNAPPDVQLDTYWHEYEHLAYDDFYTDKPIEEIEDI